jgi:hypothetical protein
MNTQFDELTALKRFCADFASIRLARLGLGMLTLLTFATHVLAQGGVPLWTNRYTVPADQTSAYRVTVDSAGNVFVTGAAPTINHGLIDWVTIGYSSAGVPLWTNRYDGPGHNVDHPAAIAVDKTGNVFVTGHSVGSTFELEYTTLAYSGAGVGLWTNRNFLGYAYAIAVDGAGNVFVTGGYQDSSGRADFATIKFSGAGVPLWTNFYNGAANGADSAEAIAVDGSGNVFVTGPSERSGSGSDWVTVKYSNAGALLWTRRYIAPGNGYDFPTAIGVDGDGNVFVTGTSTPWPGSGPEGATIGYSNSGVPLWTNRSELYQLALTVDNSGNVFVAGEFFFVTTGYSNSGVPLWTNVFQGGGAPRAVATDSAGNVFATGFYSGFGSTNYFATIAYSGAGVPLWTNLYLAPEDTSAVAAAIAVDSGGNVVVAGQAWDTNDYSSFVTIKYSAQRATVAPPLEIRRLGNSIILSWTNAAFGLQSAPVITGDFTNIAGAVSPFTNPISGPQQYFRLRGN